MRLWSLPLAVLAVSCSVTPQAGRPTRSPSNALSVSEQQVARCVRSVPGAGSPYREPLQGPVTDPELAPYLSSLPPQVRRTAIAAGVESLLARLLRERARADRMPTAALLELRQQLDERIASLPGQLLSTEFECECVIAAIDHVLREHAQGEHQRELSLTIATLVAGAGFSLAAGTWDLANNHARAPAAPVDRC